MRLSQNHVDYIAFLVHQGMRQHPNVTVKDPNAVVTTVRRLLVENLQMEAQIEREAEEMLKPHRQQILREGADYQAMLREGKKTLAKKKGFVF
ncbi:DUF507 family protein [bacterium]|nr:DUF507 family protein [bacterium]